MDYAIPGASAPYRVLPNSSLNPGAAGPDPDTGCRVPVLLERYCLNVLLAVSALTDYLTSADFGFHAALIPAAGTEAFAKINLWRTEHHLPMYVLKRVKVNNAVFTLIVLNGKKFGFDGTGASAYEKLAAGVFKDAGITRYAFFPCRGDSAACCPLSCSRGGKKPTHDRNVHEADPLDFTLADCVTAAAGADGEISGFCNAGKTVREIFMLKLHEDLKELGAWHNQPAYGSFRPRELYPDSVMKELKFSDTPVKTLSNHVKFTDGNCRAPGVLKLLTLKGWRFYASIKCCEKYEELISHPDFRKLLGFEPVSFAGFNPVAYRDLEAYLHESSLCAQNLYRKLAESDVYRSMFAESLARNFAEYSGCRETAADGEKRSGIFASHTFRAGFSLTLDSSSTDSVNTGKEAEEIMDFLHVTKDEGGMKLSGTYDGTRDCTRFLAGIQPFGLPDFIRLEESVPHYRNLHACFFLVHKLALLLNAENFVFGFDSPFKGGTVTAVYGKTGCSDDEALNLMEKGIVFRGMTSPLVCGGPHAGIVYRLSGSFDRVTVLKEEY